jgi:heterodisulfide reductase subunit C
MRSEVLSSPVIWRCVQCYSCTAKCPQNVKFRDVMRALREMAVEEGHADVAMIEAGDELGRLCQKLRRDMADALVTDRPRFEKMKEGVESLTGLCPREP